MRIGKVLFVGLLSVAGFAAQAEGLRLPPLGFRAGVFLPLDSEIRGAFGNSLFQVGVGPAPINRPKSGSFSPEVSFTGADRGGNRFLLIPVSVGFEYHFPSSNEQRTTYARLSAGVAYYDYSIKRGLARISDRKVGSTGALELGMVFNRRFQLAAKYSAFQIVDGFNFHGVELSAGVRF